jgi:hypothetical protein
VRDRRAAPRRGHLLDHPSGSDAYAVAAPDSNAYAAANANPNADADSAANANANAHADSCHADAEPNRDAGRHLNCSDNRYQSLVDVRRGYNSRNW